MTPAQKRDENDLRVSLALQKALQTILDLLKEAESAGLHISAFLPAYNGRHAGLETRRSVRNSSKLVHKWTSR